MKKLFVAFVLVFGFAFSACDDPSEDLFQDMDQKLEGQSDFDLEA